MRLRNLSCYILLFLSLFVWSCKKNNPLVTDGPSDYYPMHVGNYIIYRMDSLKYINVGSQDTLISYHAKEVVDDSITDNLGRLSYRVIRYLSDTTETSEWVPSIAYLVTPLKGSVEVVENNLRFIKLVTPVQDGISWLGNSYIDTRSDNSPVPYMDGWNYVYANTGLPFDVLAGTVPVTVTVNEANQISGLGDSSYTQTVYSAEVYGKNIGCIYKKFLYSVYQSPNVEYPSGATIGYGLTFNMVSHN
ncbi:MAG: hypothetical protein M3N30_02240 [Bacteroidota bacterium]|jgi:hypothetical protein|nr:hypothetical protein [Bacteroidota bacterium]